MADFVLGRLKFKWRGDWSTSTAYLIDDIVKYGGNTYVCIVNHTSAAATANFYTDLNSNSYWQLHTEGLYFKGDWADATFYKLNDVVKYGARQYRITTQHTSSGTLNTGYAQLYTDGLDFKGDWAGSTVYKLNDVVKYGAYQYKVTTAHTSTSSFDSGKFTVYSEGLQWEDTYNPSTTYQDGDVVSYGGYTYVYVNSTPSSGNTPTDDSYWDVITTGYNNTGNYSHGTSYKTGDVVRYGGNSYVAVANHSSQYPAVQSTGATNTTYWELIVQGLNYQGAYSSLTTYNIGDVVVYSGSSYKQLKDRQLAVTPGTDETVWSAIAVGSETNVMTQSGDMIYNNPSLTGARLDLGPAGSILTSNGTIPEWRLDEGTKNVLYVAPTGNDSNPGSKTLPYKTIKAALAAATSGDVLNFSNITGGTGGTGDVYEVSQASHGSTSGSGTGFTARITLDGSTVPTASDIYITNGGSGYANGDTITISSGIGSNSSITLTIDATGFGDVIWVKGGTYREQLPLVVPAGVSVRGEALRAVEVRPASGSSSTIATVSKATTVSGATDGTYRYKHPTTATGSGAGLVVNVTVSSGAVNDVTVYHGGYNYAVNDTATLTTAQIGCGGTGTVTITVVSLEDNNASYMWLMNNATNLRLMTLRGMTGTSTHLNANTDHGGAVVASLDPEGSITTQSPYLQDMTSVNGSAVGIKIDGLLHTSASSNKSILATHFTQINSDGIGIWAHGNGRAEMVSCFTYYCNKSYWATEGGFIRGLNGSSCYGEYGAVADGQLAAETPVNVLGNGEQLKYNATTFGGSATESDIASTIAINGSGTATISGASATATILRYNTTLDYLHIINRSGNFVQGETVTITKEDSSTFTVELDGSFGDSTAAQQGQVGPLIAVKSGTTALSSSGLIKVGANIKFAGNSTYYRISAVTEENTTNETATVRVTEYITSAGGAIEDGESANVTQNFSNVRLTGHDFLDVGTGDIITTNYPGTPTQSASQEDEVDELNGGRVYYVSTDQEGDFRVGDLFRIQQATGIATLNADAFDLSGLTELQLGSIGAELGATINEFSTDVTLSGDSNSAVPTERAVLRYLTQDNAGTGAWVPPTGTTAQRPTGGSLYSGAIRYNSTLVTWEGYNGTQWTGLGGGNPWATITNADSPYSIAANDRVFVDTSGGAVTVTLPGSPLTGDQIRVLDLAATFDTNNLTLARNGLNIMGAAADLTVSTENASIGLVYTGATYGWKLVENF